MTAARAMPDDIERMLLQHRQSILTEIDDARDRHLEIMACFDRLTIMSGQLDQAHSQVRLSRRANRGALTALIKRLDCIERCLDIL